MTYMNDYPSFESFLHNPWKYLSIEEETAVLCYKRKERFVGGFYIEEELNTIIRQFFGDLDELHSKGLRHHYNKLKDYIIERNLIGLILYGADINRVPNNMLHVNNYQTENGNIINLTISNICSRLLTEYIKKDQIRGLCEKSPNYDIYYNHLLQKKKENKKSKTESSDESINE